MPRFIFRYSRLRESFEKICYIHCKLNSQFDRGVKSTCRAAFHKILKIRFHHSMIVPNITSMRLIINALLSTRGREPARLNFPHVQRGADFALVFIGVTRNHAALRAYRRRVELCIRPQLHAATNRGRHAWRADRHNLRGRTRTHLIPIAPVRSEWPTDIRPRPA